MKMPEDKSCLTLKHLILLKKFPVTLLHETLEL